MLQRLLIANRGEIAVRIARTAHRLGIDTVGVYSEPDATALHVDAVDEAISLGGASAAESYLRGDLVIDAAHRTGCDAVHPGYGFLAENADFAQQVSDAGLIWVGPDPAHIRLLGDKIAAKRAAIEAGVPTTPIIEAEAGELPQGVVFPALVKAAAGGGGRGMRVVRSADDLGAAIDAASREAAASFGDGTVFIEPYIEHGRHIEVQVIADAHGRAIHLGERECSIQRRNQKIIEESPSAGIEPEVRNRLCSGALQLIEHVGYTNAATVEFMVGSDGTITFLEVNTRLQVEHPVTEAITGLDLVELQLRIAQGERLPLEQSDVVFDGHAIEVRIVAERPAQGWLPSTGTITAFEIPDDVRVDTGVRPGAEISPYYDSMIAKIIAHAPTRPQAALRMRRALTGSLIVGVDTNISTLEAILGEPDFLAAETPTSYLENHPDVVATPDSAGATDTAMLLAAVFALETERHRSNTATGFAPPGWRNLATQGQRQRLERNGRPHHVEYRTDGDTSVVQLGPWPEPTENGSLSADDRATARVRLLHRSRGRLAIEVDGHRRIVETKVSMRPDGTARIDTRTRRGTATFVAPATFVVPERSQAGGGPVCPLPGTVIAVLVEPGQQVTDGQDLVIVEAMKMEHKIKAAGDAVVAAIHFDVGDRVDSGDLLVTLETTALR